MSRRLAPPIPVAPPPPRSEAFGGELQEIWIGGAEFVPLLSDYEYVSDFGVDVTPQNNGTQYWVAPLGLPSGAAVEEIRVIVRDVDASEDIEGQLILTPMAVAGGGACDGGVFALTAWNADSAGLDGRGFLEMSAPAPYTILNRDTFPCGYDSYVKYMIGLTVQSVNHSFSGAVVRWRRTVSPAPDSATFGDVPAEHPFFQFIEALAASGITAGCGGGNYCPESPLTRGQMAVFLAKALGLHWPL
jgi:hypothetical protein